MQNKLINSAFLNETSETSFYEKFFSTLKEEFEIVFGGIYYKNEKSPVFVYSDKAKEVNPQNAPFKLSLQIKLENSIIGKIVLIKNTSFSAPEKKEIKKFISFLPEKIKNFEVSKIFKNQLDILQSAIIEKSRAAKTLVQKNEQLIEADKIRTEFLSNISHELRTPLNTIIGFSTALKDEMIGDLNEVQKKYANKILSSAIHLTGLINDILDMTKIEAGKMKVNKRKQNPIPVILEVINMTEPLANEKNIKLQQNFKSEKEFSFDCTKLRQIMYNLIGNAIKFSYENSKIIVSTSYKNEKFYIKVKDFGIGIDKKEQKHIFEKFVQLDNIYTKKYSSTGLGLTITENLVKLQGGKITVKSAPKKGTEFTVEFPLQ